MTLHNLKCQPVILRTKKRWSFTIKCLSCGTRAGTGGIKSKGALELQMKKLQDYHSKYCSKVMCFISTAYHATEINNTYVENTTDTLATVAGTWVTLLTVNSSFFTSGKKYLINAMGEVASTNLNQEFQCKLIHGATDFDTSVFTAETQDVSITNRYIYNWNTVWTAVASEDVIMQFRNRAGGTDMWMDIDTIFIMNLTDDLTENTDWFFVEDTTVTALDGTLTTRVSTGFTNSVAEDWLILFTTRHSGVNTNDSIDIAMNSVGTFGQTINFFKVEGEDSTNDTMVYSGFRVFDLTPTTQTFNIQSGLDDAASPAGNYLSSSIFALNTEKFRNHSFNWNDAQTVWAIGTDYNTQVLATSITPDINGGDVWIMGGWSCDLVGLGDYFMGRLQVANVDEPPTQTTKTYRCFVRDLQDELPWYNQTREALTGANTIHLDASGSAADAAEDRTVLALTMELAAVAGFTHSFGVIIE